MKSVVTQASTAIPVMPLYVSIMHRIMKQKGLHEEAIDQANRLFRHYLYRSDGRAPATDELGRLRLDDKELRADVQQACRDLWPKVTNENLLEITDYAEYKKSFLKLFGFGRSDVDYGVDVSTDVSFDCIRV
jgi:enoyl-[acyl-carrier protein] reductase/trans-2-enoyl-CoA reductase (NAD+)